MICTGCCNTLDHIVTYVFRQLTAKGKKARKVVEQQQGAPLQLIRLMEVRPELLQQMLSCILNIVMFEECRNQYSMSRPLLGLILLSEEVYDLLNTFTRAVDVLSYIFLNSISVSCVSLLLEVSP